MAVSTSDLATLADRLALRRGELVEAAMRAMVESYPETARALVGDEALMALDRTTDLLLATLRSGDDASHDEIGVLATELGRRAADLGVPIEQISGALRIYQREAWTVAADVALALDLESRTMMTLALASVGFSDWFTHAMIDAYVAAGAQRNAARANARQALLTTLLAGVPEPTSLAARAEACGWSLPASACVAVSVGAVVDWPADALVGQWAQREVAILASQEPPGEHWAVGPRVELSALPLSLDAVTRMIELPPTVWPLRWEDQLVELVVSSDRLAGEELCRRYLGPLDAAPARQREWLYETLAAWIDCQGSPTRVAEVLMLHPQSVRYRIARLRDLVGPPLDDPRARMAMQMALEIRRLSTSGLSEHR